MKLEIGNRVIILTGEGGAAGPGPTGADIRLVRRRFRRLFGVNPVIRIRGRFTRDALLPRDASDSALPDVWPITNNPEPLSFVGLDYCTVRFTLPLWKGRTTLRVIPEKGVGVQVRFSLPNEP